MIRSPDSTGVQSDRRYPGERLLLDLMMIGWVQTEVKRGGEVQYETCNYLCLIQMRAEMLSRAVHGML